MAAQPRPVSEIGLLLYPNALLSAVHGLTDQFAVANMIAQRHETLQRPLIRVTHWQHGPDGFTRTYDTHPGAGGDKPVILIVPPSMVEDPLAGEEAAPFADWIAEQHRIGTTLGSVCAGSFLLAEAGVLTGRSATTHWSYVDKMAKRYPAVTVDGDKLLIDDGDILTAGGMMAWTDLGLRLIERNFGPTIMMETARFMLVDPPGREQRNYSSFSPNLQHGDLAILRVQHWLQKNGARDVSLSSMAGTAGMEERTFLRRFQKATGLKPTEYCQHIRVSKARELLEFTQQTIEQIAYAVGYEDTGAFRKVFQKINGLAPGEYRTRFSVSKVA